MSEAYPLAWPHGWPRTQRRKSSAFRGTFGKIRDDLFHEIHLLGGRYTVLSSNLPLRRDGIPYANYSEPTDPGIAVYFERKGKQFVFACDRWDKIQDNLRAVQKTIEAIRGIERWGASEMMERAFYAFEALPPPKSPWDILGLRPGSPENEIRSAWRRLVSEAHPDRGGSESRTAELNAARDAALKEART